MRRRLELTVARSALIPVALVAVIAGWTPAPAAARAPAASAGGPYVVGRIEIDQPWILAPAPGATAAAAYVTIVDRGAVPDRLVRASCLLARGVMIGAPPPVGPGSSPSPATEGERLDIVGLARTVQAGEKIPLTLTFARAGSVTAEFEVLAQTPFRWNHLNGDNLR
jgi:copper(I)-binding protein